MRGAQRSRFFFTTPRMNSLGQYHRRDPAQVWFMFIVLWWFKVIFGLVWFGLVWFGLVWFGLVWFGLVWVGLVWFGLVWLGLVWF